MIKNGRRGTMSGKLTVKGVQGHIAYPQLAKQPDPHGSPPRWPNWWPPHGTRATLFSRPRAGRAPTSTHGTGASNVIPGDLVVDFNFRFCTESTPESLQRSACRLVLNKHELRVRP